MAIGSCTAVPIPVSDFSSYLEKTREAFVLVDPAERKKKIEEGLIKEAASVSGRSFPTRICSTKSRFWWNIRFPSVGVLTLNFSPFPAR